MFPSVCPHVCCETVFHRVAHPLCLCHGSCFYIRIPLIPNFKWISDTVSCLKTTRTISECLLTHEHGHADRSVTERLLRFI